MRFSGLSHFGRIATNLASVITTLFYGRQSLGKLSPTGYISPSPTIDHADLVTSQKVDNEDIRFYFKNEFLC